MGLLFGVLAFLLPAPPPFASVVFGAAAVG